MGYGSANNIEKVLLDLAGNWLCDPPNGMDRSCAATIYPVLDKPHTTGAFQDRRKIKALLRPS